MFCSSRNLVKIPEARTNASETRKTHGILIKNASKSQTEKETDKSVIDPYGGKA